MKKIISILLPVMLMVSFCAAAQEFRVYENPREIPASVYTDPYQPDQFTCVYAPWLRNFHIMNENEYSQGIMGGEACQQIRDVAISQNDSNLMYFITDTSGVYKTTTGGNLWFNTNFNCPGHDGQGIMIDKFDDNIVWVSFRTTGVYRSLDGGRVWEHVIVNRDTSKEYRSSMFAQDDEGNTYIAAGSGVYKLYRKTDEIINLTPQFKDLTSTKSMRFKELKVTGDGKNIYAVAANISNKELSNGIYVSHDGGASWEIKGTTDKVMFNCQTLAFHPEDENTIYFGASITDRETGKAIERYSLFVTKDDFATYEKLYAFIYEDPEEGVLPSTKTFYKMKFGPKNKDGIYPLYIDGAATTFPLRISYDYGKTFPGRVFDKKDKLKYDTARYPAEGYPGGYTGWMCQGYDLDMNRPGRVLFGGHGMWEKDENGKITRLGAGFSGAAVVDIAFDSQKRMFMSTMDVGAYITQSGAYTGEDYPRIEAIAGKYKKHYALAVYDPKDDNHVVSFVGSANGNEKVFGIHNSYDGGKSFSEVCPDTAMPYGATDGTGPTYVNATVLQYSKTDPNTIYSSYHNSYDNGKTWVKNEYNILDISPINEKRMLGRKGVDADTELYVTEDGGKTWNYLLKTNFKDLRGICFDNSDDNFVWFSRKLDMGRVNIENKLIEDYTSKFPYPAFNKVVQNPENPGHIMVTTSPGTKAGIMHLDAKVYESRDGGESWHSVPGFFGSQLHNIIFLEGTDEAFVCTMGGIFIYNYKEYWEFMDSKIAIEIDGKEKSFEEQPVIVNGRVMVPMRGLFETLGATVTYDNNTRSIKAVKEGKYIILTIGSNKATINGKEITLDAAPYITAKSRTMVPIRFASEALDLAVGWSQAQQKVIISS